MEIRSLKRYPGIPREKAPPGACAGMEESQRFYTVRILKAFRCLSVHTILNDC
jgi:hypothetical protein